MRFSKNLFILHINRVYTFCRFWELAISERANSTWIRYTCEFYKNDVSTRPKRRLDDFVNRWWWWWWWCALVPNILGHTLWRPTRFICKQRFLRLSNISLLEKKKKRHKIKNNAKQNDIYILYIYMLSFQLQAAPPSRLFLPNLCHGPPRVTYRHSRCGQYSIYIVYVRARARRKINVKWCGVDTPP